MLDGAPAVIAPESLDNVRPGSGDRNLPYRFGTDPGWWLSEDQREQLTLLRARVAVIHTTPPGPTSPFAPDA